MVVDKNIIKKCPVNLNQEIYVIYPEKNSIHICTVEGANFINNAWAIDYLYKNSLKRSVFNKDVFANYDVAVEAIAKEINSKAFGNYMKKEFNYDVADVGKGKGKNADEIFNPICNIEEELNLYKKAFEYAVDLAWKNRTEKDTISCSSCEFSEFIFDECHNEGLYKDCKENWKNAILKIVKES